MSHQHTSLFEKHEFATKIDHASIIRVYSRADYRNDELVRRCIDDVRRVLIEHRIEPARIRAAQNVFMEIAFNSIMHGRPSDSRGEFTVLTLNSDSVGIQLLGLGHATKVGRLEKIVRAIIKTDDPHDPLRLFARRNAVIDRKMKSPTKSIGGSSLGMLTIAALSRQPIKFLSNRPRGDQATSFLLQSVI